MNAHAITIVGIMGSGKTYLAKKIAKRLNIPCIDTDSEIKKISGKTVKDLMNNNQEIELKKIEFEIIKNNIRKKYIISTGDYTVNNQKAWDYLMFHSVSIWVNLNLNKIYDRLRITENRPYLSENLTFEQFKEIYNKRKKRYKNAKFKLTSVTKKNFEELIHAVQQPIFKSITPKYNTKSEQSL